MKGFMRAFFALAGVGLLVLTFTPTTRHVAASNPAPVSVTNTPLPVQGTVSVGNTPSVNVANTLSVALSGNASVANAVAQDGTLIPLLVMPQGRPYEDSCSASNNFCSFSAVPSNMRLVIQEVDVYVDTSSLGSPKIEGVIATGELLNRHVLVLVSQGADSSFAAYATHQSTTLYFDANTSPACVFSAFVDNVQCAISGYLIPAQ